MRPHFKWYKRNFILPVFRPDRRIIFVAYLYFSAE